MSVPAHAKDFGILFFFAHSLKISLNLSFPNIPSHSYPDASQGPEGK
jgi:hypothetical protein